MQDIRLRLFSLTLLSLASYASPAGAILALLWLAVVDRGRLALSRPGLILGYAVLVGAVAVFVQLGGGDGISYAIRILAILLVAAWGYASHRGGELLDLFVWLLGGRIGFDLGLVAEMGMSALEHAEEEIGQIRVALYLKGRGSGIPGILQAGLLLTESQLRRSAELGAVLASRGYRGGGRHCPDFQREKGEISAAILTILPLFFAIIPPAQFFIL